MLTSRRNAISAVVATLTKASSPGSTVPSSTTAAVSQTQQQTPRAIEILLSVIPATKNRAPATNATLSADLVATIERTVQEIETSSNQRNAATSNQLSGSWRLIYSDAPEITSLASKGTILGPTYQPVDTTNGWFENRATIEVAGCKLQSIVVGNVAVAPLNSINAVGVVNTDNNRIDVNFGCICFQIDTAPFAKKLDPPIRKVIYPKLDAGVAQPANDITYLDDTMRIVRGGDGSLFVFVRDGNNDDGPKMLTLEERNELLSRNGEAKGNSGEGSAELNFLIPKHDRPLNP